VQSVERRPDNPGTDTTVYAYTPAGRLESEVREGQVWYSRYYAYNLDGSRHTVERNDMLHGTHRDVYAYDPVSGRLASVTDTVPEPNVVHQFAWNPEGTLARWEQPNSYARVFGYDEERRLTKIERDYGSSGVQVAYEYGYNSDGARVWKRDVLNGQEYRYVCRIGCGGVPMRVYGKSFSSSRFILVDTILFERNVIMHQIKDHDVIAIESTNSTIMMPLSSPQYQIFINDSFNISVGSIPYPVILLPPRDIPYPFIPSFPRPQIPLPPVVTEPFPWPRIKPVPVLPMPTQPVPMPPNTPPPVSNPNPLPPPSNPIPPWVPPVPPAPEPPRGTACDALRNCVSTGGDCFAECQECCDEFCGPGNYPKCYGKCMGSNDFIPGNPITDCGPRIIDKPKFPEDLKDFIVMICELLKAWGLIDDDQVPICEALVIEIY